MADPKQRKTSGNVSAWWRVIAFGLAAGIAADVLAKRMIAMPDVPAGVPTISPPQHDARWYKQLPAREFTGASFAQIADWLSAQSAVPIEYAPGTWADLKPNVKFDAGPVRQDLAVLVETAQKRSGDGELYCVLQREGTLVIVPASEATCIRVYDVRPLLDGIEAEPPRTLMLVQTFSQASALRPIDELKALIAFTIDMMSWKDNGGDVGSITDFGGFLIVEQTDANQRQIEALLMALRRK
jgi:hypothetical protein